MPYASSLTTNALRHSGNLVSPSNSWPIIPAPGGPWSVGRETSVGPRDRFYWIFLEICRRAATQRDGTGRDVRLAGEATIRLTQNFEYCSNFPDRIPRIVAAAIRSLARIGVRGVAIANRGRRNERGGWPNERVANERGRDRVPQTAAVYGKCVPLFPFLSFFLTRAREIDFPLILPRPRTRPHGSISPGDTMNKKFTESRARCSNMARRPMSIYDIDERERGREEKGGGKVREERKKEPDNGRFCSG